MKKLLLLVLLFISVVANAQKGISYQAVILDPAAIELPGSDISGQPLVNGNVSVKFVIVSGTTIQFEEVQQTKTDAYGLVNLTIGSAASTAFNAVTWDANQKSLQVFISFNNGTSYTKVSDQKLTYTPYSLFSETAGKLSGTLEIANGGTGAITAVGARANLGLGNVDNTADAAKPISTATQAALDLKASSTDLVALSATANTNTASITSNTTEISLKAPIASPTFTGTVSGVTKAMVGLGSVDNTSDAAKPISEATQTALDLKASTADLLALSATVNTNTASITSNTTEISLKAPIASPTFTGIITATGYKIPNGTSSEYLMADGTVTTGLSTNLSSGTVGILPIESGGTGSNLQNFVDLTNSQTITGTKVFQDNIQVNQINIGSPSTGSQNTMLGAASYAYGSPGSNNTALGFFTLATLSNSGNEGNDNTAVGTNALRQGVSSNGSRNTAIGSASMSNALGSFDNVAIGVNSMNAATGDNNTAIGNYSLQNITTARENVAVGIYSLHNSSNGGYNTAIGTYSMRSNVSGDVNTAVGHNSLVSNVDGRYNTAIGVQAQESNLSGNHNTALGVAANDRNTTGSNNVVLGAFAGRYIADGTTYNSEINNSVLIGSEVKPLNNSSSNEIVIGYNAIGNGSNSVTLGNTSITNVKTSGTITAGDITYPNSTGTNGQVLTSNGSGTASWGSVSGTTNSIWVNNLSFEIPSSPTGGVEAFDGIFNGYYYKFLSLYNALSGISQTRSYITPPTSWGNGSYTVTVYYLTSSAAAGDIKLSVGVIPVTMTGLVTTGNEFGGNSVGGFQHGSTNYTHTVTAAPNTTSFATRPLQKASFTSTFNFANIDYAVVQLGRYMNQGYSYSDTYTDKVYILGVKITKD